MTLNLQGIRLLYQIVRPFFSEPTKLYDASRLSCYTIYVYIFLAKRAFLILRWLWEITTVWCACRFQNSSRLEPTTTIQLISSIEGFTYYTTIFLRCHRAVCRKKRLSQMMSLTPKQEPFEIFPWKNSKTWRLSFFFFASKVLPMFDEKNCTAFNLHKKIFKLSQTWFFTKRALDDYFSIFFAFLFKQRKCIFKFRIFLWRKWYLRLCFDGFQLCHVIWRNISLLFGRLAPSEPPISLSVVQDLKQVSFFEWQVFVCSCVVVV